MSQACRLYEPDLAATALDALELVEEVAVRRHAAGCPCCDRLLAELEVAAAILGAAVDQVAPPRGLKRRMLDAARDRQPSIQEIPQ